MKKFFLIVFILLDLVVIGVSALFLYGHVKGSPSAMLKSIPGLSNVPVPSMAEAPPSKPMDAAAMTSTDTPKVAASTAPNPAVASSSPAGSRKILFAYRNSRAKKVMIRADFTGWRAEPMDRDSAGAWRYTVVLEPGEYAYCYSVDDKSIRDPANKHTKTVGKTVVSSIVVQPLKTPAH